MRHMSPWQIFAIRHAHPKPDLVDEALFGARQGDESIALGQEDGGQVTDVGRLGAVLRPRWSVMPVFLPC